MNISARNLLSGKVTTVRKGAINSEVELSLDGGETIAAVITNASLEEMGIKEGMEAFALVKAPLVIIAKGNTGLKFSARNVLQGTVKKIAQGSVNAEISIQLQGSGIITSIITKGSVAAMALQEGDQVSAIFKASSVILAVKA
ncbi:molybdate/tungstate-binding protein, molbindin [Geotalea daltonii FRC-32]|uniref:Molybdate/tungstate-binding protein, molbindin n=1 Tax=Geotalea daltonii (strain DSM 22248 / JCM 15807 / FRC-32) TaxID=316067 RepID=B9M985_GEODF|nr:TOBE domain-containing protein [Geotalea daltonii]ACM18643.1 molybdate/tungstate-binding protein, molbindin [Geotalea daltonii FRC-32]